MICSKAKYLNMRARSIVKLFAGIRENRECTFCPDIFYKLANRTYTVLHTDATLFWPV